MLPPLGSSSPATMRRVVVLPQPDGPSSVTSSPCATLNETSSTAVTRPYFLVTRPTITPPSGLFISVSSHESRHRPPPEARFPDELLHCEEHRQHDEDQYR